MTARRGYSLQRTMIIYMLLIGFAALLVAAEFVVDTHSAALKQAIGQNMAPIHPTPADSVQDALLRIRNKGIMMVGVVLAVVVIVLTMFIKTITEPLQHLVEVSRAINAGDLSQTAHIATGNELSQLSTAIDDMATNLQEIVMLSRAVCASAEQVTTRALPLIERVCPTSETTEGVGAQLVRLTSEMQTLGQAIECFKLYSVDDPS
ncbi:putative sensor with HAMP domain [Desulfosarcina cetonica]|uniref:HAMP domain-containing protein n=1 Tax=Desulfosarcina cetonica TaxID=90730 RepID=UPI0006D20046|nr:methyl-accepting chemotaxis protein [Desulfosarcina cetonica]VTR65533.1 putative sensor with HAMP domain [Desulfosarcina cetonica]